MNASWRQWKNSYPPSLHHRQAPDRELDRPQSQIGQTVIDKHLGSTLHETDIQFFLDTRSGFHGLGYVHTLTVSFDNNGSDPRGRVYRSATLLGGQDTARTSAFHPNPFLIGARDSRDPNSVGDCLTGDISALLFYSRALTSEEIGRVAGFLDAQFAPLVGAMIILR